MPNQYERRKYEYYCPKCGQCHFITYGSNELCLVCEYHMIETPHKYCLTEEKMRNDYGEFEQNKQRLFDEIISQSPEFDRNLYSRKDSILKQKEKQRKESIALGKEILAHRVKCFYCGSTNVGKYGFFGRSRYRQFHCNNCGADF